MLKVKFGVPKNKERNGGLNISGNLNPYLFGLGELEDSWESVEYGKEKAYRSRLRVVGEIEGVFNCLLGELDFSLVPQTTYLLVKGQISNGGF